MVQFNILIKNVLKIFLPLSISSFILRKFFNKTLNYISSYISLSEWNTMCHDSRNTDNELLFQKLSQDYLHICENDDLYTFQKLINNTYKILQENNKLNKGRIIILFLFIEYNYIHANISYNYFIKKKNELQKIFIEMQL